MSFLDKLKKQYGTQDNRSTRYPIYVTVQELVCIGVMANGYTPNCPYGDDEVKVEYKHDLFEESFEDKRELIGEINEYYGDDRESIKEAINEIEEINLGYIWVDRQPFLTIKGAKEYMKANAHNMGKTRTYVHYIPERNFEMTQLLAELGFKEEVK